MIPILLLAVSYLIGAVPASYIAGRLARGIDLREHGSGNLGATNALRVLGWRVALPVMLFDVAKGWAPTFWFPRLDQTAAESWALAYGAAAIVGHVYSVYVGLRGGKGVATSAGVFLALAPLAMLLAMIFWGAVLYLTRIVSLASISAGVVLPVAVLASRGAGAVFWLSVALAIFVVYAHRANIGRLMRGEEHRFGRRGAEQAP